MNNQGMVKKYESVEEFNLKAAKLFISVIIEELVRKGEAFVALSGGSTPIPIFEIIRKQFDRQVIWEKVCIFWIDERCVSPEHQDSNFGNASRTFLDYLPGVKTFRLKGELDPERAASEYEVYLKAHLPVVNGLPQFDLIWLGMGADGHTASIFPGSDLIYENEDLVRSVWVQQLQAYRLTCTFPVINNARQRMIVLKGAEKINMYNEIQKMEEKKFPIQYIEPSDARDHWIVGNF